MFLNTWMQAETYSTEFQLCKNCPYAEQIELTEKQEDSVPQTPQNGEKSSLSILPEFTRHS